MIRVPKSKLCNNEFRPSAITDVFFSYFGFFIVIFSALHLSIGAITLQREDGGWYVFCQITTDPWEMGASPFGH